MTNKTKTPGELAFLAYMDELETTVHGTLIPWKRRGEEDRQRWEAVAKAVRKQVGEEIQAVEGRPGLIITQTVTDMVAVEKLRLDLSWWWIQDWAGDTDAALSGLLDAVGPFMPDESDEPKPESAAECAEDAGAEPSKSPPPAKR